MRVSGWGRYPVLEGEVVTPRSSSDVARRLTDTGGSWLPRGLGRSYGDSSLNERMLDLTALDGFVTFDEATGTLMCEAGVSLAQIIQLFLPRGWFLPVTPGTAFVTVGGAIASDVHGKNHHRDGTFTDHVASLRIVVASGETLECSRDTNPDLFHATCGGMGLTGVIVDATLSLMPVSTDLIDETVVKAPTLERCLESFDEHADARYSVAWIDLVATGPKLGRSLVMLGEHVEGGGARIPPVGPRVGVPVEMPGILLNRATVSAFNSLYNARVRGPVTRHTVGYRKYFYPLDAVGSWNRLYGRDGFVQYQLVIPAEPTVLRAIVERVARAGAASPLAVLKVFGSQNANLLSFPAAGYTLAMDFKATPDTLVLCDALDAMVLDAGGRLYLTKDSRMSAETFHASYPRVPEFEAVRHKYGAVGRFASAQSRRLELA